jgi:lipopolysaccharide export system ATP-binding protein
LIRAVDLAKTYHGRKVVNGVELQVNAGEVVGLLGANGAGKTTTFTMIVGLVKPSAGRIYLDEKSIGHLPLYRRARLGISYLPQEPSAFRSLSVEENIRLVLQERGIRGTAHKERLNALLEEFGLVERRRDQAISLSGGERRRLEIARSLAFAPRFLLLDEPFTGIDPIQVAEVQEIVKRLRQRGMGILITDHNVRETLAITDRAYIIREGEILVSGDGPSIAASPVARKYYLGENYQTGFEVAR